MTDLRRNGLFWLAAGAGAYFCYRTLTRSARALDLRGKVVLITGGSRGLGLAMAREFARHGARLALAARDRDELQQAVTELQAAGVEVLAVPCDVTVRDQVMRMVESVTSHYGVVDVLVNNAGVIEVAPMEVMTLDDYEEAMKTHFWAPLYTTLAVLPQMRDRGAGRILNIASIGGKVSVPHLLPYSASKFALVGFSEGLRAALAKEGVLVTTAAPGLMRTGSPRNATFKGQHRAEYAWFTPAPRGNSSTPVVTATPRWCSACQPRRRFCSTICFPRRPPTCWAWSIVCCPRPAASARPGRRGVKANRGWCRQ
jgi:NAD(P)-dependent dehydrogenase (short-subunit alcohol dehydrogenase family)